MFESTLENPSEGARAKLVDLFQAATAGQLLNGVLAFIAILTCQLGSWFRFGFHSLSLSKDPTISAGSPSGSSSSI